MNKHLSPKQQYYRKGLLAKIHQAPHYCDHYADNEDGYRAMLQHHFGKRSAADLTISQLKTLLDFLQGITPAPVETVTPAQINYIKTCWQHKARDSDLKSLMVFVNKIAGVTLIGLHALSKQQANGVINAINRL